MTQNRSSSISKAGTLAVLFFFVLIKNMR